VWVEIAPCKANVSGDSTFLRTCTCSLAVWFLTCFLSELGSVYRLEHPSTWQAYGFCATEQHMLRTDWAGNDVSQLRSGGSGVMRQVALETLQTSCMKMTDFWDTVRCSRAEVDRRFRHYTALYPRKLSSSFLTFQKLISGCHGGESEVDSLLGCRAVNRRRNWPTFWKSLQRVAACSLLWWWRQ
jgi:hypothetical protein